MSVIDRLRDMKGRRERTIAIAALVVVVAGAIIGGMMLLGGTRRSPSIFDTPIDGVADFLISEDFSKLPVEERLEFLADLAKRFQGLEQSESASLAAFLAGLSGPAREQARDNARLLAKDILLEGAAGYLALTDEKEKAGYIDQWLIRWVRFGEQVIGEDRGRTDAQILAGMREDARRDVERGFEVDRRSAQFMINMWESEVSGIASPAEQGAIFMFLPAVRDHLVKGQ